MLVDIVKSFHTNMGARISVDGKMLEEIEVCDRDAQWPPTLFNLYACVVAERWLDGVQDEVGVGTRVLYKQDQQLFHRSTRNASEMLVSKVEFADDVVLLASTREAAEAAISRCDKSLWTDCKCTEDQVHGSRV